MVNSWELFDWNNTGPGRARVARCCDGKDDTGANEEIQGVETEVNELLQVWDGLDAADAAGEFPRGDDDSDAGDASTADDLGNEMSEMPVAKNIPDEVAAKLDHMKTELKADNPTLLDDLSEQELDALLALELQASLGIPCDVDSVDCCEHTPSGANQVLADWAHNFVMVHPLLHNIYKPERQVLQHRCISLVVLKTQGLTLMSCCGFSGTMWLNSLGASCGCKELRSNSHPSAMRRPSGFTL